MDNKHDLGLTVGKNENFGEWYTQLITKGRLIEYYDVSGCYVLLPNSYFVWEQIQGHLDKEFKKRGVKNAYFPLLITRRNLEKEETHIEGFSPEVAWITKTGNSEIDDEKNHLAIRPTSECAIYPVIPNLIRSHTDLPLKLNQWCNVVRWEFKDATPFIRSREFLWQEGHTCYGSKEEAVDEVYDILGVYQECFKDLLAIPTINGKKTEKEKFCGADLTTTLEGYIPVVGKGIQCCTSHCLGQNFSKMFGIEFSDKDQNKKLVYQNSWGFTTRSIGIMLMTHSDDKGVVFPPKVAPIQVVIIPILFKKSREQVLDYVQEIVKQLDGVVRVHVDDSNKRPGWKQNYWEVQGVPIKLEVGPRDTNNRCCVAVRRDTFDKITIEFDDLVETVGTMLNAIHDTLYDKALKQMDENVEEVWSYDDFVKTVESRKLCLAPFCNRVECETKIKGETSAKTLCIPDNLILEIGGKQCVGCEEMAKIHCLFGKSY